MTQTLTDAELVERLERSRAARAERDRLNAEADALEGLQAELTERRRLASARQRQEQAQAQAVVVVDQVRPDFETWRADFGDWLAHGAQLVERQKTLQGRLVPPLDLAVAAAAALAQVEAGPMTEEKYASGLAPEQDRAVDQVLDTLGVADLDPFPRDLTGLSDELANVVMRWLGRWFKPGLGRVNFQRLNPMTRRALGG